MTKQGERRLRPLSMALRVVAALGMSFAACGGDDSKAKPAWEGTSCGGIAGSSCPPGDVAYCDFDDRVQCGATDGTGVCRARPDGCTKDCPGICGCDGKFYCNACEAHRAGADDAPGMICMHGR
jgi:hypothetical protein